MNEKEIEDKHNEMLKEVEQMTVLQLSEHLVDHSMWYSEYTENTEEGYSDQYWNMQRESAILCECAHRLRMMDGGLALLEQKINEKLLERAIKDEQKFLDDEKKNNTP